MRCVPALLSSLVCSLLLTSGAAAQPPMPQPGPAHELLKMEVGTWDAVIEMSDSAFVDLARLLGRARRFRRRKLTYCPASSGGSLGTGLRTARECLLRGQRRRQGGEGIEPSAPPIMAHAGAIDAGFGL